MSLQDQLAQDMKSAMKSGDKLALGTHRMIRSQIQNASLGRKDPLTDDEVLQILNKEAKRRQESIQMYNDGGRQDLADKENEELEIIQAYLPEQLDAAALEEIIQSIIKETCAATMQDLGKVMGQLMPKIKGRADGKLAQEIVKQKLS